VPRLILCSASPARLATLRAAGLDPEVIVSGVDESGVQAESPSDLVMQLATLKAGAVHDQLAGHDQRSAARTGSILIGCDSVLDLDGTVYGKPRSAQVARERWLAMRGRTGTLLTGHHLIVCGDPCQHLVEVARTGVTFADLSDTEIDAYIATGEPLVVAGAFTLDGLGGAFVDRIEGDPHNVVGISLPLVRAMLTGVGVAWPTLWQSPTAGSPRRPG